MNKRQKKKREKLLSSYDSWDDIHISWKQKRQQKKYMQFVSNYLRSHKEPKSYYIEF